MSYYYPPPRHYRRRPRRRPSVAVRLLRVLTVLAAVGFLGSMVLPRLTGTSGGGGIGGFGGLLSGPQTDGGATEPGPDIQQPGVEIDDETLTANPLYAAGGVPATECPAPVLTDSGTDAQRAYDEFVFGCLNQGWTPVLERAGMSAPLPDLYVFDSSGSGPCGSFSPSDGRILAFYCPANQTMYADAAQMSSVFPADHHIAYALVLAHEYGHHVQNVSGILAAERAESYSRAGAENEMSRRTETQASCFAGMFIRGIEASYPVAGEQRELLEAYAYQAFGDPGDTPEDERTHGTSTSQGRWIERGFTDNDAASCNTFTAPAESVE